MLQQGTIWEQELYQDLPASGAVQLRLGSGSLQTSPQPAHGVVPAAPTSPAPTYA